jgi:hypothetical protein
MVLPKRTADHNEVHMVRTRISTAEELATWDALLSAVHVARRGERLHVAVDLCAFGMSGQDVKNGFGRQARHRRTSGMLEQQW